MNKKIASILMLSLFAPSISFADSVIVDKNSSIDRPVIATENNSSASDSDNQTAYQEKVDALPKSDSRTKINKQLKSEKLSSKKFTEQMSSSDPFSKTASSTDRSMKSISSNLITNGDFEAGHTEWTESYRSSDGNWYDWTSTIMAGGGYGNWSASLTNDEALTSATFTVPLNTTSFNSQFAGKFWHSGTCVNGANGVGVTLYDNTTNATVETIGFFNANTTTSDTQFYQYSKATSADYSSRIGHNLELTYIGITQDPNCNILMSIDNVSLTANKTDSCNGTTCGMYRFQNKNDGTYLFTGEDEGNAVLKNYSGTFLLQGLAFNIPLSGDPIYRFQNKFNGTYLFTGENEKNAVLANYSQTFTLQGVAFYVPASGTPIYRFQNKFNGTYLFTGETEKNAVIANYSKTFTLQGLAFYSN